MLTIGAVLFEPGTRSVFRGHETQQLSPKAAAVLMALAETPREVWSRDALMDRVWPGVHVGEDVLTHAVAELRRALGDDFRAPKYLQTVHKSGYRLLMPLEPAKPDAAGHSVGFAVAQSSTASGISLKGYADYLSACELFERGGRRNTLAAIASLASVLETQPGFALAHAAMAKALAFLSLYYEPRQSGLERALDHCGRAHRI